LQAKIVAVTMMQLYMVYHGSTRVVQKVLQMLGFHRYKHLILAKFVMHE